MVVLAGIQPSILSVEPSTIDISLYTPVVTPVSAAVSLSKDTCPLVHTSTLDESANLYY